MCVMYTVFVHMCCEVLYFFFFKQKTAYEMRISDWSSDVCSSDLVPRWGPYDFKAHSRDGLGVDWPIGYDDIAPFYDRVERMIGVNGGRIELENHPDSSPGCLMPPPKPRIPEMLLDATCESMGIPVRAAHTAVLTRDMRSEEHTSELQSLMRISYAVFCLKTK